MTSMVAGDFTQATTGAQPKIFDSSTGLVMLGNMPAAKWDGTDDFLGGGARLLRPDGQQPCDHHGIVGQGCR